MKNEKLILVKSMKQIVILLIWIIYNLRFTFIIKKKNEFTQKHIDTLKIIKHKHYVLYLNKSFYLRHFSNNNI